MKKFPRVVEDYLADLLKIRASGGATGERSGYGPLANLLNEIGGGLKPKVFCVSELADQGAGHPDFGLFAAKQVQRGGQPRDDQLPEHGVVEVKSAEDDAWLTAESAQVSKYWSRYRLVLVTNYRDFLLVGEDANGNPARLERFRLAADAEDFERQLEKPRAIAGRVGVGLGSTCSGCCRTGHGWRNLGTWPNCWPRTRETRWRGWRPPKSSRVLAPHH